MMSFKVELLPDEPILVSTFDASFSVSRETRQLVQQMLAYLDAATEPLYMVDDTLLVTLNFSDLVGALALVTRGETDVVRHKNLRRIVIVTKSDIVKFGTTALKQTQYGGKEVAVYSNMEDALAAIRMELSRQFV
jgi:hypothetical protein